MRIGLPSRALLSVCVLAAITPVAEAQTEVLQPYALLFQAARFTPANADSGAPGRATVDAFAVPASSPGAWGTGLTRSTAGLQNLSAAAQPVAPQPPKPLQGPMLSMYGGFVALQAMDVHSTMRAIESGAVETNPMMRWATAHPVALVSVKTAAAVATVYCAEKIRKKHPRGAMVFMAAINTAYAIVVAHNYRIPNR